MWDLRENENGLCEEERMRKETEHENERYVEGMRDPGFFSSLNHTRLFVLCIIICHINGRPTHCRSILSYTTETRERPTLHSPLALWHLHLCMRAATLATDGSSRWGRCRSRRSRRPWRTWRPCTRRRSAAAPSTAGCRCTPPLLYIHTMHI